MPEEFDKKFKKILVFATVLLVLISVRLVDLQLVNGTDYRTQSENRMLRSMPIAAPRGEILDRYGRPLVTNRMAFSLQIQKTNLTKQEQNAIILDLIALMQAEGEEYIDSLPINAEGTDYTFDGYEGEERQNRIARFNSEIGLESGGAFDAMALLCETYEIDPAYTPAERRAIAGVRYEMDERGFSVNAPYTFAKDVGQSVITRVREQNMRFKNVAVVTEPIREYVYDNLACHILGRVGPIYKEEYAVLKNQGYGMNDTIGKDGMEKYLEPYIKGVDGRQSAVQTVDGRTTAIAATVPATPGDHAVLTIDLELQQILEQSLQTTLESVRQGRGKTAQTASAVVMDVNTGEILAIASYPGFNPKTFDADYSRLYNDPLKPMFNRAIAGAYPPGSTFKMLTSVAALEEGAVTVDEIIQDQGVYRYYGQTFNCWIWSDERRTHGNVNVSGALRDSCNYYFYEAGKRLGVDKLAEYGKKFGLGEYTGIELEGETKGILANPDYKKKTFDQVWFPGDTLQMAIGQSFNLFSPIQLASYTATIANGGTRYKAHLLKSVRDVETGALMQESSPEVYGKVDMSHATHQAITYGMRMVSAEGGTAGSVFGNFPIEVCSKTGSAEVSTGVANGIFVSFAPYKNPQIAVAAVVENAGSGNAIAPIARDIYTAYFGLNAENSRPAATYPNTLLP
ncbi:MAG: penicillin-binding protein 2 [Ruminococcaceae bacterium]|nr:penicillin-binding protein 2 [Oscillospiraceae bacterium]